MRILLRLLIPLVLAGMPLSAASKPHVITFGKWTTVETLTGPEEVQKLRLKVRPLYVDGKLKEFTEGTPHEITERLFVVQRMIRVNDSLPSDTGATPQWVWQLGGWIIVDRGSGHVAAANLPKFEPELSLASWYRDYAAYCGISADGKKIYATVVQLGRRKPILDKPLDETVDDSANPACASPSWQRHPPRVTFRSQDDHKLSFAVRRHAVEVTNDDEDENGTE
jgi:hypothetical protein